MADTPATPPNRTVRIGKADLQNIGSHGIHLGEGYGVDIGELKIAGTGGDGVRVGVQEAEVASLIAKLPAEKRGFFRETLDKIIAGTPATMTLGALKVAVENALS